MPPTDPTACTSTVDRDGVGEAWLVAPDGRASPEGVAGLVMPAPAGGWRVIRAEAGVQVTLKFLPPGGSQPAFERIATWGQPAWVSARELAYCDMRACHRLDVSTGADLSSTPIEAPAHRPITVGSDGTRWFATSYVGQVTRHVIANLADRPWAR